VATAATARVFEKGALHVIVDSNVHYWRYPSHYSMEHFASIYGQKTASLPVETLRKMNFDQPFEDYWAVAEKIVDKAIVQELNTPDTFGVVNPHEDLYELTQKYKGRVYWMPSIHPFKPGAVEEFERCVKEMGAVGLGEWAPAYMQFYENDERCFPLYEKCIELDVPVLIHSGPVRSRLARLKYVNLFNLDEVAIRYPSLKIIINHLGWYKYEDAVFLMQKHANIYADISWLGSLAGIDEQDRSPVRRSPPVVTYPYFHLLYPLVYCLSGVTGGRDKLIFGSDWPGSNPVTYINILNNINELMAKHNLPEIPEKTIHDILHENWKKVFRLD
jgi:predicted TIM-barrel fold metal-dependent hydrolase